MEKDKNRISTLSEELLLNINKLSAEKNTLAEKNEELKSELASTKAALDEKLNSLIIQAGEVIQRLEKLSDSENEIRQQIGLESQNGNTGGKGGAVVHEYNVGEDMSLEDKLDYSEYLIDSIAQHLEDTENSWLNLKSDITVYYDSLEHMPHLWPVPQGSKKIITSGYGLRQDPFNDDGYEYHEGIDIGDDRGTIIIASASGTVTDTGWDSGFGYYLLIDHGNGYTTKYSHCSKILVKRGAEVSQGDPIAHMGSTGRSTGSHLDFRIYYHGKARNPMDLLD